MLGRMGLTIHPVSLTVEQVEGLNRKLSDVRHDINNNLTLMVASLALLKARPGDAARLIETFEKQPEKIAEALNSFTVEFEATLGITHQP